MPDPIIPILSVTIGAISFLATVRNAIDLILRDKDHVQRFVLTDLVLVGLDITEQSDRLEFWKRHWSLHDGIPNTVFTAFWGISGASQVLEALEATQRLSEDLAKEFESTYGLTREAAHNRLARKGLLQKHERSSASKRHKIFTRALEEYHEEYGVTRRIKLALFHSSTFQAHLKSLQESTSRLESLAISKFELQNHCKYDESAANKLKLEALLLFLGRQAAECSSKVINWCKCQQLPPTMAIDFQIDLAYDLESLPRDKLIADRAERGGFPYHFRLPNDANIEDGNLEVAVKDDASFERLKDLVDDLAEDPQLNTNIMLNPQIDNDTQKFNRLPSQHSESLRKVLSAIPRKLRKSTYHQFSLPERYKLAYELSENAMVLLNSPSLCDLCVCAIRRLCLDPAELEYDHYLRINNAHELESHSSVTTADRWCREKLLNMHIQRLGIILTEISTGAAIADIRNDEETQSIKIVLNSTGKLANETGPEFFIEDVADLVEEAAGADMARAVSYCLRCDVQPSQIEDKDLASFYNRVVAPLYLHYEGQILEPRRKRQIRYSASSVSGSGRPTMVH